MKVKIILLCSCFLLLLGCEDEKPTNSATTTDPAVESMIEEINEKIAENTVTKEEDRTAISNLTEHTSLEEEDGQAEDEIENEEYEIENADLSDYTMDEIEYARVWLQLGTNPDIEELYVMKIPAGTPLHPTFEDSAVYPEDVIQLTGSRLLDGSVTYSNNGDGTINVYHVPLRWEAIHPKDFDADDMKIFTESIVANPMVIEIENRDDQAVIDLIEKIMR